ncbi:MAG: hypothetical protein ACR2P3_06680 [Geminicoccaceae bacterium]
MGRASSPTPGSLIVDANGRAVPVMPSGTTTTLAASGTQARSGSNFSATCKVVTIRVTGTAIRFLIGDDTITATDADPNPVLLDGEVHDEPIMEDGGGVGGDATHDRISIIAVGGGAGTVYVTERE